MSFKCHLPLASVAQGRSGRRRPSCSPPARPAPAPPASALVAGVGRARAGCSLALCKQAGDECIQIGPVRDSPTRGSGVLRCSGLGGWGVEALSWFSSGGRQCADPLS